MEKQIRKTLLHGRHLAQGANMADFGGYNMPLWYPSGAKNEHIAVLTHAGLFDTSHMAAVKVTGSNAHDLLQRCFTRDLNASSMTPGKCVYGAYLNDSGGVIDDAIVYPSDREHYLTVVNAGMGGIIAAHLSAQKGAGNVEISDLTDQLGKLDIQGPMSAKILKEILAEPEKIFQNMPYFSFKGHVDPAFPQADAVRLKDGTRILLSRTGYTGEFGFEIFIDPAHFVRLWEMISDKGKTFGIVVCGLAARDSLRAGAVLPLSHQDIGNWLFVRHPWDFALPYNAEKTGFTKTFIGDKALMNAKDADRTYPFAGDDLRKITPSDQAVVADAGGNIIGGILTCVTDMGIGRDNDRIYSIASPDKPAGFTPKGLSCGFVKVKTQLKPGDIVELRDARRRIKVMIVNDIRPARSARRALKEMI
jgi:aminomethyltransferase